MIETILFIICVYFIVRLIIKAFKGDENGKRKENNRKKSRL